MRSLVHAFRFTVMDKYYYNRKDLSRQFYHLVNRTTKNRHSEDLKQKTNQLIILVFSELQTRTQNILLF